MGGTKRGKIESKMFSKFALASGLLALSVFAAEKYNGPVPPKPDVPYLLHASTLVPTEVADAREEGKNDEKFVISGASSPARTPLAEPIFLIDARQLSPENFQLYRLDVKGRNREVMLGSSRRGSQPLHLAVRQLSGHLYRVEADQPLENGEYVLSPNGDNRAFCFEIY
jgi:hypothetical protein